MEQSPFRRIEFIKKWDDLRDIEPLISQPLSDMGPVFLFYMCIIILMICPATGKLYPLWSFGKMSQEMIIEELSAVITVKPA